MSYIGETFGEKEMLRFFCDQFAMSAFASSSILQERRKLWLKLMGQTLKPLPFLLGILLQAVEVLCITEVILFFVKLEQLVIFEATHRAHTCRRHLGPRHLARHGLAIHDFREVCKISEGIGK